MFLKGRLSQSEPCLYASRARVFTAQRPGPALQGDLPGEGVPSGLLRLQLLLGAREHVPPQEQHLREVVADEGGTWVQAECVDSVISVLINQS